MRDGAPRTGDGAEHHGSRTEQGADGRLDAGHIAQRRGELVKVVGRELRSLSVGRLGRRSRASRRALCPSRRFPSAMGHCLGRVRTTATKVVRSSTLRQLGMDRATVVAVAIKPEHGGELRYEHIPPAQVDTLKKAIVR